jgi:dynein heavy chain
MDDNKVLTLVSNERIPLSPSMRLLFEISNLKNGSPATVSRAGVLFLNETDVGWQPFFQSWVDRLSHDNEHIDSKVQTYLETLVQQYVPPTIENMRKNKWNHITPIMNFAMVASLTSILEGILTVENCPQGTDKDTYEAYFQFAAVWAFGGAFGSDKANDFRKMFSEWWKTEFGCGMDRARTLALCPPPCSPRVPLALPHASPECSVGIPGGRGLPPL